MRALIVTGLFLCTASPGWAQKLDLSMPPAVQVTPLPSEETIQPISLTRAVVTMQEGEPWLDERGSLCLLGSGVVKWQAANAAIQTEARLSPIFDNVLGAAGFKVGRSDPSDLFETSQRAVDLQAGARITSIRARACDTPDSDARAATVVMDVEWQIFSVSQNRILARIPTTGGHKRSEQISTALGGALYGAFAENVRVLSASEVFRSIVTAKERRSSSASPVSTNEIHINMPMPVKAPLDQAAKGVVSVFTGSGHGSGVLVSPDGYILTNHHVAGASGKVRVRWPDGTDSVGEVIRGDARRDVALIKTTPKGPALAIRRQPLQVGETVFAIGTPLDKELAGTVTRGAVSGFREKDGLPMIQSDAAITQGNSGGPLLDEQGQVVALSVSVLQINGAPLNINFFIPIEDALRVLALNPAG